MGRELKTLKMDNGMYLSENACESYECRSCGKKMVSVNFVNGICIQVFTTHKPECQIYTGTGLQRTVEVTCETCRYNKDGQGCTFEGEDRLL